MYYIIDHCKNGKKCYYIMDIEDKDIQGVEHLYKSLYNGVMFKNFYPIEFLDTLERDNNIIKQTPLLLLQLFCKWMLKCYKKVAINNLKYIHSCITLVVRFPKLYNYFIKQILLVYNYIFYTKCNIKEVQDNNTNTCQIVPQCEDSNNEFVARKIKDFDIKLVETTEDIKNKNIPLDDINTMNPQIFEETTEHIEINYMCTDIDHIKPYNNIDVFSSQHKLINQDDKVNKEEKDLVIGSLDIYSISDIEESFTPFSKTPWIFCSVKRIIKQEIDDIQVEDFNPETCNAVILTTNNEIYVVDKIAFPILNKLCKYGIDDIFIKDVTFYPDQTNISVLKEFLTNVNNNKDNQYYIYSLYQLRKLLYSPISKDVHKRHVKDIIKYIHNDYVYEYNSSVSLSDLYLRFIMLDTCKTDISFLDFIDILKYLGYHIKDRHVLYIKNLPNNNQNNIFKPKTFNGFIDLKPKNLQLRVEPKINVDPSVSPWHMNSNIQEIIK